VSGVSKETCPQCNKRKARVADSRRVEGRRVRRYRCLDCAFEFHTAEIRVDRETGSDATAQLFVSELSPLVPFLKRAKTLREALDRIKSRLRQIKDLRDLTMRLRR